MYIRTDWRVYLIKLLMSDTVPQMMVNSLVSILISGYVLSYLFDRGWDLWMHKHSYVGKYLYHENIIDFTNSQLFFQVTETVQFQLSMWGTFWKSVFNILIGISINIKQWQEVITLNDKCTDEQYVVCTQVSYLIIRWIYIQMWLY